MRHQHLRDTDAQIGNLVLGILAVGLSLLIVELLLWIIKPAITYTYQPQLIYISHFRPSTFLPFELRPNNHSRFRMLEFDTTVHTNSRGMRDREVDFSKPRIICMGDSFTFGFGVENDEAFCTILEEQRGGKYDFLNAGYADGYSPDTYAIWLSKNQQSLNAEWLLICLFQNDYSDVNSNMWLRSGQTMPSSEIGQPDAIIKPGHIVTPDGAWMRDSILTALPVPVRTLLRSSYLVAFLRDRILPNAGIVTESVDIENLGDTFLDRKFIRSLELLYEAADGKHLVFYLIPSKGQTTPSHMDLLTHEFATTHHVPVLSNTSDFSELDYFPLDAHWTRTGHMKAAQYLLAQLTTLGL